MAETHLWFLWCCLVDFRQQALQLWPVTHQLMVDPVSLVQQSIDVCHGLKTVIIKKKRIRDK